MINLSIHEPQKRRGGWFTKRNNEKKCISYIKYIMNNIDIYIYTHECCLFCGITCLKKLV